MNQESNENEKLRSGTNKTDNECLYLYTYTYWIKKNITKCSGSNLQQDRANNIEQMMFLK